MNNKERILYYIVLLLLIGVLLKTCNSKSNLISNYNTLSEEVELYKVTNDEQVYRIETLQSENVKTLTQIKTKDSTINVFLKRLRDADKKIDDLQSYLNYITGYYVSYIDSISANTVVGGDTVIIDSMRYVYLTYEKQLDMFGKWIGGYVRMGKTTFDIQLSLHDEYEVTIGRERKNLFAAYKYYTYISTKNPYNRIESLKSYSKSTPKSKFIFGIQGGYGLTPCGLQPYVGVGVTYKLIEL